MSDEMQDISSKYELRAPLAEGGQGLLRRGRKISDGLDVVIKKYSQMADSQSWNSYEEGEIGAAREIAFLKRANKDGVSGVPVLLDYGLAGAWKEPIAVFEPISGRTLEEEVSDPEYNFSQERIRWFFDQIIKPLEYAHHSNGTRPIVHRDISPKNVIINGKNVVLMDWAAATPTSGKTYHGKTNIATLYYTAPEVLAGTPLDGRADIYSLGRVLQVMLLGQNLFETADGNPSVKDFESLNIPRKVAEVLERAVQKDPDKRYRTVKEFHDAFEKVYGVTLSKVPARAQPSKKQIPSLFGDLNLPAVIDNKDGTFTIGKLEVQEGLDVYTSLNNLRQRFLGPNTSVILEEGDSLEKHYIVGSDNQTKAILAYVQYAAQKNGILRSVAQNEKSLEEVLKESNKRAPYFYPNSQLGIHSREDLDKYREGHKKKIAKLRKQLGKIFLEADKTYLNQRFGIQGAILGYAGGVLTGVGSSLLLGVANGLEFLPWEICSVALGSILGSNIQRYNLDKRLSDQARVMDSWIAEAQKVQNPSPLERKAEESVNIRLTDKENTKIIGSSIVAGVLGAGSSMLASYLNKDNPLFTSMFGAFTIPVFLGNFFGLNTYLRMRKLKQKRIAAYAAAGLDKDGMREYKFEASLSWLNGEEPKSINKELSEILPGHNLKRKKYKDEYIGEGIDLTYKYSHLQIEARSRGVLGKRHPVNITIKAKPELEEKVREIYSSIAAYFQVGEMAPTPMLNLNPLPSVKIRGASVDAYS